MDILIVIADVLYIISGIICGIGLFGNIYHKISERTSEILSNIAFVIVCISVFFLYISNITIIKEWHHWMLLIFY